ncbi:MAG: tetratricopeptide repeat protein [Spirosomataceae bacterium]
MNNNRLLLLHQFYEEDTSDPFNVYALAMEYQNHDILKATEYFKILLAQFPDYLPTYYHAAALSVEIAEIGPTEMIYQQGMALALKQQNTKTYQELQRAYQQWKDDQEDW